MLQHHQKRSREPTFRVLFLQSSVQVQEQLFIISRLTQMKVQRSSKGSGSDMFLSGPETGITGICPQMNQRLRWW